MKIRTFIAFNIEPFELNNLIKIRDEVFQNSSIKFESNDKLHITIKFIGDIEEVKISELIIALQNIANSICSFELNFSKFGLFKKNGLPAVIWAGINESTELLTLHKIIENNSVKIGFEKEKKKYKPHLTLIRFKRNNNFSNYKLILDKEISNIRFRVTQFSLIKSELKITGSEYTIIKKFILK